jgi:hypothetical protein
MTASRALSAGTTAPAYPSEIRPQDRNGLSATRQPMIKWQVEGPDGALTRSGGTYVDGAGETGSIHQDPAETKVRL